MEVKGDPRVNSSGNMSGDEISANSKLNLLVRILQRISENKISPNVGKTLICRE